jgi:hypothetical protein
LEGRRFSVFRQRNRADGCHVVSAPGSSGLSAGCPPRRAVAMRGNAVFPAVIGLSRRQAFRPRSLVALGLASRGGQSFLLSSHDGGTDLDVAIMAVASVEFDQCLAWGVVRSSDRVSRPWGGARRGARGGEPRLNPGQHSGRKRWLLRLDRGRSTLHLGLLCNGQRQLKNNNNSCGACERWWCTWSVCVW